MCWNFEIALCYLERYVLFYRHASLHWPKANIWGIACDDAYTAYVHTFVFDSDVQPTTTVPKRLLLIRNCNDQNVPC